MSIHIFGAFIDYLQENNRDMSKPMIAYKAELAEWKKLYNSR